MSKRKSANLNKRYKDNDTDFVLTDEIITHKLPAGIGQTAQLLPEPITTQIFSLISVPAEVELAVSHAQSHKTCKSRKCRKCNKTIKHEDRHRLCKICTPILPEDNGDAIFF